MAVRFVRTLLLLEIGAWLGMAFAAAFLKRALPSLGNETSDEISLVAIFDGVILKSRARAFQGGSMLAWFGGVEVDLREAELAPGALLKVNAFLGGIAIRVPEGWQVESGVKAIMGGVDVKVPAGEPDAPTLRLEGNAFFGGIAVSAKPKPAGDEASATTA